MTTIAATGRVRRRRVAVVVAVLLLGASGLLVLGVLLERHAASGWPPSPASSPPFGWR
jgi:hypothetical protein